MLEELEELYYVIDEYILCLGGVYQMPKGLELIAEAFMAAEEESQRQALTVNTHV